VVPNREKVLIIPLHITGLSFFFFFFIKTFDRMFYIRTNYKNDFFKKKNIGNFINIL